MAEPHAHSQPIQTYGPAPHNRNIWPHNSQATAAPSRLADSFVCPSRRGLPTTDGIVSPRVPEVWGSTHHFALFDPVLAHYACMHNIDLHVLGDKSHTGITPIRSFLRIVGEVTPQRMAHNGKRNVLG